LFIGYSTVFLSYATMRVEQHAGSRAEWLAAAVNHVGGRKLERWSIRARRDEQHAKAVRTGIVLSLFLVLLMAALLVGGRALIDPLLQSAADDRDANRVGEIVYTMPDGAFCRHLAFDNVTGEVTERTVEQCDQDIGRRTHAKAGFSWHGR
jgi:hypothetical protein